MLLTVDIVGMCFPGNDNLHEITSRKKYILRVDLEDFEGATRYAKYSHFAVANERYKYWLVLGTYSGTAGDYVAYLFFMLFLKITLACLSAHSETLAPFGTK